MFCAFDAHRALPSFTGRIARGTLLLFLAAALASAASASPTNYTILDLGTLGGSFSTATAINASGQVVGYSALAGDVATHAFRTSANGVITPVSDLGTLGGTNSYAFAINSSGQVVGASDTAGHQHAFRTASNGAITASDDLGDPLGYGSSANAINDSGQVAGNFFDKLGSNYAFRSSANGGIPLASVLGGNTSAVSASGLNKAGQAVGYDGVLRVSYCPQRRHHARKRVVWPSVCD
jgi:probable HAF family extracellular repeat protein